MVILKLQNASCPVFQKDWYKRDMERQAKITAEGEERRRREEEERRRAMAAVIATNPCEVCGQEVATHVCNDVRHAGPLKVGDACWDEELATCMPCCRREDAKRPALAGASAPEPEGASGSAPAAPASADILAKVHRLLGSSKTLAVPCGVAAKATECADPEEFAAWWAINFGDTPGIELDYDANVLRAESKTTLGALDAVIAALQEPQSKAVANPTSKPKSVTKPKPASRPGSDIKDADERMRERLRRLEEA